MFKYISNAKYLKIILSINASIISYSILHVIEFYRINELARIVQEPITFTLASLASIVTNNNNNINNKKKKKKEINLDAYQNVSALDFSSILHHSQY